MEDIIEEQTQPEPWITHPQNTYVPTPNDPPWNGWIAFGVWVASVVAIAIFPALFLAPYLVSSDVPKDQNLQQFLLTDSTALFLQVLGTIPAHIATVLLAWLVITNNRKYPFLKTIGWESGKMRPWHYAVILVGFFAIAAVVGSYINDPETDFTRLLKSSRSIVFLVAFMATVTAPFVEELIYRGMLYSAFQRRFGVPLAIAAVTLIFTLVHVPQYYESIATISLLACLSLILTLVRFKTGNLWPCVVLHTLFNGFQSAMLILEPYFPTAQKAPEAAVSMMLHLFK